MQEIFRGQVEARECDHYGHQNVRYYVRKTEDGIHHLLAALGWPPARLRDAGLAVHWADHHMRFLRELYAGTPVYAVGAPVAAEGGAMTVYAELRNARDDAVAATFLVTLRAEDPETGDARPFPADLVTKAAAQRATVPAHARPRGLTLELAAAPPTPAALAQAGYGIINKSVVRPEDVSLDGRLGPDGVVAKHSEGFENFYARLRLPGGRDETAGWILMEGQYHHHGRPRVGDLTCAYKGLVGVSEKVLSPRVWLLDPVTGAATAEIRFVILRMDLEARAIRPFTAEEQAMLRGQCVAFL